MVELIGIEPTTSLAALLGISTSYLSDIKKGRAKGEGYKFWKGIREKVPHWLPYSEEKSDELPLRTPFIQIGAKGKPPIIIPLSNNNLKIPKANKKGITEKQGKDQISHVDLIPLFQDKDLAKEINEMLLSIEALDAQKLKSIKIFLQGVLWSLVDESKKKENTVEIGKRREIEMLRLQKLSLTHLIKCIFLLSLCIGTLIGGCVRPQRQDITHQSLIMRMKECRLAHEKFQAHLYECKKSLEETENLWGGFYYHLTNEQIERLSSFNKYRNSQSHIAFVNSLSPEQTTSLNNYKKGIQRLDERFKMIINQWEKTENICQEINHAEQQYFAALQMNRIQDIEFRNFLVILEQTAKNMNQRVYDTRLLNILQDISQKIR